MSWRPARRPSSVTTTCSRSSLISASRRKAAPSVPPGYACRITLVAASETASRRSLRSCRVGFRLWAHSSSAWRASPALSGSADSTSRRAGQPGAAAGGRRSRGSHGALVGHQRPVRDLAVAEAPDPQRRHGRARRAVGHVAERHHRVLGTAHPRCDEPSLDLHRVRVPEIGTYPIESVVCVRHQAGGHRQRDQFDRGIHKPEHRGVVARAERAHQPFDLHHVGSDRNQGHAGTSLSMSRSA